MKNDGLQNKDSLRLRNLWIKNRKFIMLTVTRQIPHQLAVLNKSKQVSINWDSLYQPPLTGVFKRRRFLHSFAPWDVKMKASCWNCASRILFSWRLVVVRQFSKAPYAGSILTGWLWSMNRGGSGTYLHAFIRVLLLYESGDQKC